MLTDITKWCYHSSPESNHLILSPFLLSILLNEDNETEERFIQSVKDQLNRTPKYLDVPFDAPPFPFDHTEFEDPFCLVEDLPNESVDLEGMGKLSDEELTKHLRELFAKFTYSNNGRIRVKKKELLDYVGKRYFLEMTQKDGLGNKSRQSFVKRKKSFGSFKTRGMNNVYIPGTMKKSILRRKAFQGGSLLTQEDILNFKRRPEERADILVAIDSSKSMELEGKLEHAKKAALSFYYYKSTYFHESRVEFVSFNNTIKKVMPIDILSLKPDSMTHTAELLHFFFDHFNRGSKNLSELYLITDGYPQHEGIDDRAYHAITLKSAERLQVLDIKTKMILLNTSDTEKNLKNYHYNKLICKAMKGELIQIDITEMADVLTVSNSR